MARIWRKRILHCTHTSKPRQESGHRVNKEQVYQGRSSAPTYPELCTLPVRPPQPTVQSHLHQVKTDLERNLRLREKWALSPSLLTFSKVDHAILSPLRSLVFYREAYFFPNQLLPKELSSRKRPGLKDRTITIRSQAVFTLHNQHPSNFTPSTSRQQTRPWGEGKNETHSPAHTQRAPEKWRSNCWCNLHQPEKQAPRYPRHQHQDFPHLHHCLFRTTGYFLLGNRPW